MFLNVVSYIYTLTRAVLCTYTRFDVGQDVTLIFTYISFIHMYIDIEHKDTTVQFKSI